MREPEMNMAPQMNFDTHKLVKFLVTKGIKTAQAESIVEVVNQSRQYDFSKLATKDQVKLVETRLEGKIDGVEERLMGAINALKESSRREINTLKESSRGEIKAVEERVMGEIRLVREEMKASEERTKGEIIGAKNDTLKWIIALFSSMMLTMIGLIVTIILKN